MRTLTVPFVLLVLTASSIVAQSPLDRIAWLGGCLAEDDRASPFTLRLATDPGGLTSVARKRVVKNSAKTGNISRIAARAAVEKVVAERKAASQKVTRTRR